MNLAETKTASQKVNRRIKLFLGRASIGAGLIHGGKREISLPVEILVSFSTVHFMTKNGHNALRNAVSILYVFHLLFTLQCF